MSLNNDRSTLRTRLTLAADWFVNAQCKQQRPYWDANHGRFPYNRYLPDGKTVWGLNWTQARGIMVLIAADRLAPDARYMESARLAAEYIEILQVLDPRRPEHFGAIREEVPQSRDYNIRDQAEAASALLYLGVYLGEAQLVERARLWGDWYLKYAVNPATGWPWAFRRGDGTWANSRYGPVKPDDYSPYFLAAHSIFFHQLGRLLGEPRYIREGVVRNAEFALAYLFDSRGAIRIDPSWSQHASASALVLNEDGATIGLMAATRATGRPQFAQAALGHIALVLKEPLGSLGSRGNVKHFSGLCNTMMVAAEAARVCDFAPARTYIGRVLPDLLAAQLTDAGQAERGAFVGEDEEPEWYSGGGKQDYVTTRCTAYGALALAKIEGTVVTGGYSADAALPVRAGKT
jgi:hypothetical protein